MSVPQTARCRKKRPYMTGKSWKAGKEGRNRNLPERSLAEFSWRHWGVPRAPVSTAKLRTETEPEILLLCRMRLAMLGMFRQENINRFFWTHAELRHLIWQCVKIHAEPRPLMWQCVKIYAELRPLMWQCVKIYAELRPLMWQCVKIHAEPRPLMWQCVKIHTKLRALMWQCVKIHAELRPYCGSV
jgi:hypothetical protein